MVDTDEIRRGDVVWVKGLSTKMTVDNIKEMDGAVECVWFDTEHRLQRASFNAKILTKTSPATEYLSQARPVSDPSAVR